MSASTLVRVRANKIEAYLDLAGLLLLSFIQFYAIFADIVAIVMVEH